MNQSSSAVVSVMPDIAQQALDQPQGKLSWLGMNRIHQPLRILHEGPEHPVQALADVYVDRSPSKAWPTGTPAARR
jgi:hypothetical protein